MKIYAVEWCFCIYESGFSIESLHLTKSGAYKAMRKTLVERWNEDRWGFSGTVASNDEPLRNQRWRIREIEVKE